MTPRTGEGQGGVVVAFREAVDVEVGMNRFVLLLWFAVDRRRRPLVALSCSESDELLENSRET